VRSPSLTRNCRDRRVYSDAEIETAVIALGREPGGGLVVMPDIFMAAHRAPIISAAARNSVPADEVIE
jgi:putative ABC transport system substrate-binding protein